MRLRAWITLLSLSLLTACGLAACGGDDERASPTTAEVTAPAATAVPVVVDTDLASDDLVALAFLLSSTEVDVRAVTVSGTGEVRCPQGLEVIRGLLAVTGDEDVPVACGRTTPLVGDHTFPSEWRDAADDGWGLDLPPSTPPATDRTAVDLLDEALEPGGMTLLTLGPLTNVAEAFRADPELAGKLSSIVVMGGAVDAGGNVAGAGVESANAEWNIYVDPTAAAEVLASGAPITLVGLDATNQAPITADFLELLRVNAHTEPAALVQTLVEQNPSVYTGDAYFWDPLAAAVVVDPELVTKEEATIEVVTEEGSDSGRTVRSSDGHSIALATGADTAAFEELLIRTIDGLADDTPLVTPPPPVGEALIGYESGVCSYEGPSSVDPGRMRLTFETTESGWFGGVAHLSGELSVEEVLDWIEANPGNTRVPGVDQVIGLVPGIVVYDEVAPGENIAVCAFEQAEALVEVLVADTFTVE